MQHLGVHQSLSVGDEDALADLLGDIVRLRLEKVRLSLSLASWSDEFGRRFIERVHETLQPRSDVLLSIDVQGAAPELLTEAVRHLATNVLNPGSHIELQLTPQPVSVWERVENQQERLRLALSSAVAAARRADLRVVLGVQASACSDETLLTIAGLDFMKEVDAVLVDCTDALPDNESPAAVVARVRQFVGPERVWLAGGLPRTAFGAGVSPQQGRIELARFVQATEALTERVYWRHDDKSLMTRLLARIDHESIARWTTRAGQPSRQPQHRPRILVTGGAGFIGCNLSKRLLENGAEVVVFDNLGRPGVEQNLAWLEQQHGDQLLFMPGDVRDRHALREALDGADHVFHLAGQVAVTTSLDLPIEDFEINARGTLNVLEELRRRPNPPGLLFTSTNKVYGNLGDIAMREDELRWLPADRAIAERGIDEHRPLDLHSPYGCSKGAGDQYVLDYARSYGLRATVFRMSCIYGPRQFGTEDQGWLAHFILRALRGETITIYGDGKQVRDVLFVEDLVDAMTLAMRSIDKVSGRAFNLGGGPSRMLSLRELLTRIERRTGRRPTTSSDDWRQGDQRYFVADTSAFQQATGWRPQVSLDDGIERLTQWLESLVAATRTQPTPKRTLEAAVNPT